MMLDLKCQAGFGKSGSTRRLAVGLHHLHMFLAWSCSFKIARLH